MPELLSLDALNDQPKTDEIFYCQYCGSPCQSIKSSKYSKDHYCIFCGNTWQEQVNLDQIEFDMFEKITQ